MHTRLHFPFFSLLFSSPLKSVQWSIQKKKKRKKRKVHNGGDGMRAVFPTGEFCVALSGWLWPSAHAPSQPFLL
jgi:hypothetical protein